MKINEVDFANIVTNKDIVPELLQNKFNIDNICYETEKLIYDKQVREEMINGLAEVKTVLSEKYSAQEVANCILEALN